ncbi:accessory Sec system glycosyltransferase GtfA [Limosilactobacillus mucosae]|uniref:accessory Sec system glycosyltransferase GtfA n=1 Tax=Limosilactobacillus mucosae TaxID=97478 RepID=UPI00233EB1B8|nr:accessory Sec system glycosyltransferase GtfA [Limosilactobacillus mucosae]MDC2840319.1 accessory Sec system glycosyltransferase GtfA [Limosilactobacillus mucosae]
MTVYNVNLGIGWASSGVEYAQAYRAKIFEQAGIVARFIFSDMILADNIQALTSNLGLRDEQVIWLYNFFTDMPITPSTYSLDDFRKAHALQDVSMKTQTFVGNKQLVDFESADQWRIRVHVVDQKQQLIDYAEYFTGPRLVRREFFSASRYAVEYLDGSGQVYLRDFLNQDGSVAYHQYLNGENEVFEFPERIYYSKTELYAEMIRHLNLQADDLVILDREDSPDLSSGQLWYQLHGSAKLGVVVHAEHYDAHHTDNKRVLWNNFYEYQFVHAADTDFFIVATAAQQAMLVKQLKKYQHVDAKVVVIPVGSLTSLKQRPYQQRRRHTLITASRLASEKHIDWLISAVIAARRTIGDLVLDIYGYGEQHDRLQRQIDAAQANGYIHLMGQHRLDDVYQNYAGYIAASTSEGFGLSLLEAVGGGLPMIGFNVPYGNQTFIDPERNGFLLPYDEQQDETEKVAALTAAVKRMFADESQGAKFSQHSYEIAEHYLDDQILAKWQRLVKEEIDA